MTFHLLTGYARTLFAAAVTLTCSVAAARAQSHTASVRLERAPNAAPASFASTAEWRGAVEDVIKEYLLRNPAIVRDALQALQAQEQAEKAKRQSDAIAARRDALTGDNTAVGGNPNGDVTIIEFLDYRCGYCKRLAPTLAALTERDPMVRIVYKDLPILGADSVMAARASLAAARQGKYVEFHKALFAAEVLNDAAVREIADKLGLGASLASAMNDPAIAAKLDDNIKLGAELGVEGTPALIIGNRLVPGAVDLESLAAMVAAERERLQQAKKAAR